jgi:hypothetical protein
LEDWLRQHQNHVRQRLPELFEGSAALQLATGAPSLEVGLEASCHCTPLYADLHKACPQNAGVKGSRHKETLYQLKVSVSGIPGYLYAIRRCIKEGVDSAHGTVRLTAQAKEFLNLARREVFNLFILSRSVRSVKCSPLVNMTILDVLHGDKGG